MPKPEITERILISFETQIPEMGGYVAQLARMGAQNLKYELITDIVTFNRKTSHAIGAEAFLTSWVAEHPSFKAIEAIEVFRADGRTDGACYSALRVLAEKKILRKLSLGAYARSDVKQLAAPKKKPAKKPVIEHRKVSHLDFVLKLARRNHGRFSIPWMKAQFEKDGRKWGNVSPTISALLQKKQIKRVGDGEYVLLQKAVKTKPEIRKTNGQDAAIAAAEVTDHG